MRASRLKTQYSNKNYRGKSKGKSVPRSNLDKNGVECFYCHTLGHMKNQCPKLKNKDLRNKQDGGSSASMVENKPNESDVLVVCNAGV